MNCVRSNKIIQKMFSLCLILALAILIANPSTHAELTGTPTNSTLNVEQNSQAKIDYGYPVDTAKFTNWLTQRGYSIQDFSNISSVQATKLLLSISGDDINKSMDQIRQDLFGNSTGPVPAPHRIVNAPPQQESTAQSASAADTAQTLAITSTDSGASVSTSSPTSGQACFIVGIWAYQGVSSDSDIQAQYNSILYNVNYVGYDYVKTLTNSGATHDYIWEWLTWLCATYQNVDVYLIGHGTSGYGGLGWGLGYCSYDSSYGGYVTDSSKVYQPAEMTGYLIHPYEYNELRLGLGSCCFGGQFYQSFVYQPLDFAHQNLADTKDRVWMGPETEAGIVYLEYYDAYWSYAWYVQDSDSCTAYNYAYSNAAGHQYGAQVDYYYNTVHGDDPITFPAIYWLSINAVDDWGMQVYPNIYLDGNWVGSGSAYVQVTPGWHSIDADNPTYDPYFGDVYIQYGTGSIYCGGGTTYDTIMY